MSEFESVGAWVTAHAVRKSASGKTIVWELFPHRDKPGDPMDEFSGVTLGEVRWCAPWRKYAFYPENGSWYEADCLIAIGRFCKAKTVEHRAIRAAMR